MLKSWGHSVVSIGSVGDNLDLLRDKIHDNLERVDVFVTTGGVSTGKEDFVAQFLNREAQVINWRIAIKPGRPFICAKLGNKYVFGLPGNPVAHLFAHSLYYVLPLVELGEKKLGLSLSLLKQRQIL